MTMFQKDSHFQTQQSFQSSLFKSTVDKPQAKAKIAKVEHKRLEDWAHRLGSAADEAQDESLHVLNSDLLDLRDEVLLELHESLLD